MKSLPPLMLLCWGVGTAWYARVTKVGAANGKWRLAHALDTREFQATSAREAVRIAVSRYGKEPRTCRRCGKVWECRRTRAIKICPACQTKKAVEDTHAEEP